MAKSNGKTRPGQRTNIILPAALADRVERLRVVLRAKGVGLNLSATATVAIEALVSKLEKEHGIK